MHLFFTGGDKPYSRQIISEYLKYVCIPIFITVALIIGGFILNIICPQDKANSPADKYQKFKEAKISSKLITILRICVFAVSIAFITYGFFSGGALAVLTLLFNANIKGFINGSIYNNPSKTSTKNFCVPGLNCYSCPGAIGACPLGALYGLFNRFSIFGLKIDDSKCTKCNLCVNKCKMDVYSVSDHECILCGECIDVCPTKAISWKGSKIFLAGNDIENKSPAADNSTKRNKIRFVTRLVTTVVMLAVLFAAIAHYWIEADKKKDLIVETGNSIGMKCPGYDLEIVTANGPTGETINPVNTGKITIINFWYTMCTSCVAELPYFDQIAEEYDNVSVIAVHSELTWSFEEAGFIKKYYPDSKITFVHDYADSENNISDLYYKTVGGKDAYPYTVIIDENGIIVELIVGSTTYNELKSIIDNNLT